MQYAATSATRIFLLLGESVAHSLSPVFHNAALRDRGIDALYAGLPCDHQSVGPLIRALCRAGGGGNVTIPHKAAAAQCVERPSDLVMRTGACNTFWGNDGVVCGDNTDVAGFHYAASLLLPELNGATSLILGAGGAAAAAACALIDAGASSVTLMNRSPDRARALAGRLDRAGSVLRVVTSVNELVGSEMDLVVNASSVGLHDNDPVLFDLSILRSVRAALDVVYRSDRETPFVRHARSLGITSSDGRDMLLAQGAAAFVHWFGGESPIDVMRDALGL